MRRHGRAQRPARARGVSIHTCRRRRRRRPPPPPAPSCSAPPPNPPLSLCASALARAGSRVRPLCTGADRRWLGLPALRMAAAAAAAAVQGQLRRHGGGLCGCCPLGRRARPPATSGRRPTRSLARSFPRVHWVAVPTALRARRVNRRLRLTISAPPPAGGAARRWHLAALHLRRPRCVSQSCVYLPPQRQSSCGAVL
jgi:hypothetical protein